MGDAVPLVCELLSAAVSGGGNSAPALTAFDNFDTAMIDCHAQNPFYDGWHNNATRKGVFSAENMTSPCGS